jgi:hypothetical protein
VLAHDIVDTESLLFVGTGSHELAHKLRGMGVPARHICHLHSGHTAGDRDVKRWRYRVFSMAGKLVRGGRQTRLLLPRTAPEAELAMGLHDRTNRAHQHFRHGNLAA